MRFSRYICRVQRCTLRLLGPHLLLIPSYLKCIYRMRGNAQDHAEKLDRLVEMGFPREAARSALERAGGDEVAALDALFASAS